ncbi:MAG: penicillin-binding protein [Thermoanaerobaculia bacterium]
MSALGVRRLRLFSLLLLLWGALVVGRLVQVQIAEGPRYRARAQRQQERRVEVPGRRGSILDREGRELAVSVEAFSIFAIPDEVESPRSVARALAPSLGIPAPAVEARLTQKRGFVWLARKIDPSAADAIRASKLPGIHRVADTRRFYPKGPLAASVLGYVGTDDQGLGGLEYLHDAVVRGKPGEIIALTDARRSTYGEAETAGGRPSQEGATLTLSLDSGIQFAAERELAGAVAQADAKSGSAVLLDPVNGEILAMASVPAFDPNQYGRYSAEVRRNHAIADAYEPGSTFKIVTGAVALEHHRVTLQEIIDTGDGAIRVGNVTINEDGHHGYGPLTLSGVFEHSSNVGIIRVGLRLGPRLLFEGASAFGVGRPTGVDLPGESSGIFRPLARWSSLSNASISMGQEVALTPLQLARIAAVVANGGMLVEPHLVTRVLHPNGSVTIREAPAPARILSPGTARALKDILVGVVERGTGRKAAIAGLTVAGKTGTAQKAGVGGYQAGRYIANFVGFAPAEKPRIVGVVVIEEPRSHYYAADVAAPVFARIVSQALGILRVAPPEQNLPTTMLASSPGTVSYPEGLVPVSARRRRAASVPNLTPDAVGLSARQALALFARLGLPVRLQGTGFVISQNPPAGSVPRPGETHTLVLSESAASKNRTSHGREEASSPLSGP